MILNNLMRVNGGEGLSHYRSAGCGTWVWNRWVTPGVNPDLSPEANSAVSPVVTCGLNSVVSSGVSCGLSSPVSMGVNCGLKS
jgi:hypothetical protein